ncbi:ectoine/hydroxyectoine ABC transporter substrate-binding protein EhuB [Rhizobium sp.]
MTRIRVKTGMSAIAAIMAIVLSGNVATAQELKDVADVSIAIGNDPPYTELKADGTLTGIGPDIDKAILGQFDVKEFRGDIMAYGAMIPALQAKRVRMVSSGGLNITPQRCEQVIYSEPVLCGGSGFLLANELASKVSSYKQVAEAGIKIGVPAGSSQQRDAVAAGVKRENVVTYPDLPSAIKMLQDKRLDVVASAYGSLAILKQKTPDDSLTAVFVTDVPMDCSGAAFNKEDTALRDAYNAGLRKIVENGEYAKIAAKYGMSDKVESLAKAKSTAQLCQK